MRAGPLLLAVAGCGHPEPRWLSETGIDADGVISYQPRFELWSDGATKRRFLALPPDQPVDAADPDAWRFPAETRLWKEFTRDGVRAETRMLHKLADGEWTATVYVWEEDGSDARREKNGRVDALGTAHDVPAQEDCAWCHDGAPDGVLGFSAVQLHQAPEGDLATLVADGLVSEAPEAPPELPGDAVAQQALGVLHANCAACHNPRVRLDVELDLELAVGDLGAVEDTATYRSTVGVRTALDPLHGRELLVAPGDPDASLVAHRMGVRDGDSQMPPLATEEVDRTGLGAVEDWITSLPP